jgi:hypothetical protein
MRASHPVIATILLIAAALAVGACGLISPSMPAPQVVVDSPEDAVGAVIAHEPRLTGITPQDPDLIGQSAWYEVAEASGVGAYVVQVRVGWGDCPSGCIDEHTWTYAVLPDGTVNLQEQAGPTVPDDAWPAPGARPAGSGVELRAFAGPVCPVETQPPDPACAPRPVTATVEVRRDGASVASVTLAGDGRRLVPLPPGRYTVEAAPVEGLMGTPAILEVEIPVDGWVTADLAYDTGIR